MSEAKPLPTLRLMGFYRSGPSHRVRIALNLKGLAYAYEPVSLPRREHQREEFLALNPQGLVPVLEVDGVPLAQSPAILEWLEETYPIPTLLPGGALQRQRIRALSSIIACDVHPINNLRILNYLRQAFHADETVVATWCRHWIGAAFTTLETLLERGERTGFCCGDAPTLADCHLIPQIYSARRFGLQLDAFPLIRAIDATCGALPAFAQAHPDKQPDAPPNT